MVLILLKTRTNTNGTVLYTSNIAPTYPLLVDTSLYDDGSTLTKVMIFSGGGAANVGWTQYGSG